MTPEDSRASYRMAFDAINMTIVLKRLSPAKEATVRARTIGFTPEEIASGIDQGDRKILVLAEDVEAAIAAGAWPTPPAGGIAIVKNDRAVVRGRPLVIQTVDDSTRRIGDVLMAYEITASGS